MPRPSTAGANSRRSSLARRSAGRPSTAGSVARERSREFAETGSRTGSSVSSNGSNASNASFLDRFVSAADRREQKLLMMQKKEEVHDALIKRAQIDGMRPFTPELVREVAAEVDRVVNQDAMQSTWANSVGVEEDETDAEAQILNHEGKWSFGEVLSAPSLGTQTMSFGSRTAGSRTVSWGRTQSQSRSRDAGSEDTGRWSGMNVTPWRRSESGKFARESMVSTQSRSKGAVVMGLWDRLRTTTTRTDLLETLRQQPTLGPLDGGFCNWQEFEQAMLGLTLRLSIIEAKWLKKEFSGHQDGVPGAQFSYRGKGRPAPFLSDSSPLLFQRPPHLGRHSRLPRHVLANRRPPAPTALGVPPATRAERAARQAGGSDGQAREGKWVGPAGLAAAAPEAPAG